MIRKSVKRFSEKIMPKQKAHAKTARGSHGPFADVRWTSQSVLDLGRQLAAIGSELGHHLLVQPDIHAGGIVGVAGIAEFLGELLARGKAGVDVERLHQVDRSEERRVGKE